MTKPGLVHLYALGQVQGRSSSFLVSLGNRDSTHINILPHTMSQMGSHPQSKSSGFMLAAGLGQREQYPEAVLQGEGFRNRLPWFPGTNYTPHSWQEEQLPKDVQWEVHLG